MKPKIQTFSFLMELIIVILFFAASATVCASFIVMAKNKQTQATHMKDNLLEAQSMIETMQANPQKDITQLFDVVEIQDHVYQKDHLVIEIIDDKIKHGTITIYYEDEIVNQLPFVLGGHHDG